MSTLDLSILIRAIDGVTAPVKRMTDRIDSMLRPLKKVGEALNNLGKAAGVHKVAAALKKTGGAMGEFGREAGKLALKIGAVTGAFGYLIKQEADAGDLFAKVSQRVGTSVSFLSQYSHGVELAGGTVESFAKGMKDLSKNIVDASRGGSTNTFFFKALKIDIKGANGELKKADEVLLELADRFSRMPDGPQKLAAATQLLGKSGEALIPFLSQGAEALRENREEAERLGLVWSEKDAAAAEEFNDSLTSLHGAFRGVIKQVATQLFPALTPLIKKLTEWIVKNRELIAGKVIDFIGKVSNAAEKLWKKLNDVWDVMKPFVDLIGPENAALLVLAGTIGGPLIASIFSLIAAFATLGGTMLATPVGWVMLALAGIAVMALKVGLAFKKGFNEGTLELFKMINPLQYVFDIWAWIIEKLTGFDIGKWTREKAWPALMYPGRQVVEGFGKLFGSDEDSSAARAAGRGAGKNMADAIARTDLLDPEIFSRALASSMAQNGIPAFAEPVKGEIRVSILDDRVKVKGITTSGPVDVSAGVGSMLPGG